jgi:hypothetical protein
VLTYVLKRAYWRDVERRCVPFVTACRRRSHCGPIN